MLPTRRHFIPVMSFLILVCAACGQCSSETIEANKQIVRDLFAALDAQDFELLEELSSEDFVVHAAGSDEPIPRAVMEEVIPAYYTAFPDYRHVIEELVAEGDLVLARVSYLGTHEEEFEGIPATGNAVNYSGMQLFRIVDGLMREVWLLEDNLTLMSQLGMQLMPGPDPSAEAKIREVRRAHLDASTTLDIEMLVSTFAEDGVEMPPESPAIVGRDAYREFCTAMLEQAGNFTQSFTTAELVVINDEWAFERGTYSFTPEGGAEQKGKYIWMYQKNPDGQWRFARTIYNSGA